MNQQFRIQKFTKAVPGPVGATDDLVVLAKLVAAVGGATLGGDVAALWPALSADVPAVGTMLFKNIPDTGLLLDATPFAALSFVEGETLHYKPSAPQPAATPTSTPA